MTIDRHVRACVDLSRVIAFLLMRTSQEVGSIKRDTFEVFCWEVVSFFVDRKTNFRKNVALYFRAEKRIFSADPA